MTKKQAEKEKFSDIFFNYASCQKKKEIYFPSKIEEKYFFPFLFFSYILPFQK
jgi:hypothetical protein